MEGNSASAWLPLVQTWREGALKASSRHSNACDRFTALDSGLAVGSAILAAIAGASIVASLGSTTPSIKIGAGVASLIAAVLSGIQATMKWGARSERHRVAARAYGAIARQAEELADLPPSDAEITTRIDALRKALDDAGANAPNVPGDIWRRRGKPSPEVAVSTE